MKFKRINLNQIINLVLLVVAIVIAISINKGQNKKIAQIRRIQNEQKEKNEILLRLRDLNKRIDLFKETFKPRHRREIINTITKIATTTGVKIISLKPKDRTSVGIRIRSKIYEKIIFHVNVQVDSYHQLGKFISSLERNPVIFGIEKLGIGRGRVARTELSASPERLTVELIISGLFVQ